jgi:hypothetical protein
MINKQKHLNLFIISLGFIILFFRVFNSFNGIGWSNIEISIASILVLFALISSIIMAIKKKFFPLALFFLFSVAAIFTPFEFGYGIIDFEINKKTRAQIEEKFQIGGYDSLILKNKHPQDGTRIINQKGHIIDIFQDKDLKAIFFFQTFYGTSDYCGILYLSNEKYVRDKRVYNLLKRDFEYKRLDSNWYWIRCFTQMEPGP